MRLYKTQYSFRISGNRGYDSNRVRYQVSEMVQPLSGSLHMFFSVIKVTEINPQTMNLPQDTIIKVGRGGGQQPGK